MVELNPLMKKVAGNIKGDTPKVVETRASQERRWKKSESQKPNRPNIQKNQQVVDDTPVEVEQRIQEQSTNGGAKPVYVPKDESKNKIISRPELKNVYTKQQYVDLTKNWVQQAEQNKEISKENISTYESIQPEQRYKTNIFGQEMVVSGKLLKTYYYTQYNKAKKNVNSDKAVTETKKIYEEAKRLPKGTRVEETTKGFTPILPESVKLEFTKTQLKKFDKSPPVIRELQKFAFGIQSAAFTIAKPVAEFFGKGKEFDIMVSIAYASGTANPLDKNSFSKELISNIKSIRHGVYYASTLDLVFEPIGIAPKGSSDIIKRNPFFAAGGIAGEVIQGYAISKVVGTSGKIAGKGVKGVVKRVPTVYTQVSKKFPKVFGTIVTESGSKAGSKSGVFISKVGSTSFSRNIYKWGAKGYKPGRGLLFKSTKLGEKAGYRTQYGKYIVDKSTPRRFLSPKQFSSYYRKINTSGQINIAFPSSKTDDIIFAAEGGVWRKTSKGLKGFNLSKTSVEDIGNIFSIKDETFYRRGLGSFYRNPDDIVKPVVDVGYMKPKASSVLRSSSPEWSARVQPMYTYGYPTKTYVTESGKQIIDYASGFGKGISPPMPKPWISKVKYGLVKSKEATASLIRKTKTTIVKRPGSSIKSFGVKTGLYMPVGYISPTVISSSLYIGGKVGLKTFESELKERQTFIYTPIKTNEISTIKLFETSSIKDIVSDVLPIQNTEIKTTPVLKQDISTEQKLELKPKLDYQPIKTYTPLNTSVAKTVKPFLYGLPYIPPMGMSGRGRRGYSPGKLSKKYRFRKFNIPTIGGLKL